MFFPEHDGQTLQEDGKKKERVAEGREGILQGDTGQEPSLKRSAWLIVVRFLPPALQSEAP